MKKLLCIIIPICLIMSSVLISCGSESDNETENENENENEIVNESESTTSEDESVMDEIIAEIQEFPEIKTKLKEAFYFSYIKSISWDKYHILSDYAGNTYIFLNGYVYGGFDAFSPEVDSRSFKIRVHVSPEGIIDPDRIIMI